MGGMWLGEWVCMLRAMYPQSHQIHCKRQRLGQFGSLGGFRNRRFFYELVKTICPRGQPVSPRYT